MRITDCVHDFKIDCELRRLTPRTIKGYVNNNLQFAEYLQNEYQIEEIEEVKQSHIKQYVLYLTKTGHKATYINGILKCLRAFFKYCYAEEFIERNPATKVPWQREGQVLIETFTDDEVKRLLDAFDYSSYLQARNKLIIALAFDTGVRNTEMCNILIANNIYTYGNAYEYVYRDESGTIRSKLINVEDGYPIYNQYGEYVSFIEYWNDVVTNEEHSIVYTPSEVTEFNGNTPVASYNNATGLPIHYTSGNIDRSGFFGIALTSDLIPVMNEIEALLSKMTDSVNTLSLNPLGVSIGDAQGIASSKYTSKIDNSAGTFSVACNSKNYGTYLKYTISESTTGKTLDYYVELAAMF